MLVDDRAEPPADLARRGAPRGRSQLAAGSLERTKDPVGRMLHLVEPDPFTHA